jgi:hypothetical protein
MSKSRTPLVTVGIVIALMFGPVVLTGCQNKASPAGEELLELRAAMNRKTEQLLNIHLRLDTALSNLVEAESLARSGDCADVQYRVADAYNELRQADSAVLDLGIELQALFNLDAGIANER